MTQSLGQSIYRYSMVHTGRGFPLPHKGLNLRDPKKILVPRAHEPGQNPAVDYFN